MKRNILSMVACLLAAVCVSAATVGENVTDTVLAVKDCRAVVITESNKGLSVEVSGNAGDPGFVSVYNQEYDEGSVVKSRQRSFGIPAGLRWMIRDEEKESSSGEYGESRWELVAGGLGLGLVNAASASGPDMPSQMGKSFEVQWLYVLGVKYAFCRQSSLTFGVGLDWRNYRTSLSTEAYRPVAGGGSIAVGGYPSDVVSRGSRVKVFSVLLPLIYNQSLPVNMPGNSRLGVFMGPVVSLNTHASVLTKWTQQAGNEMEESCSNIGQRFFTVDLMCGIRFCGAVSVYFKYSPQTVLKSPSPQFRAMSTGIMLNF